MGIPGEASAMARSFSAASRLLELDIIELGVVDERIGEADRVDAVDDLSSRALRPGLLETRLGYADLIGIEEDRPADPDLGRIVP